MKATNFQVLEVRLFGSHARGNSGPASDLDILCIVDTQHEVPMNQAVQMTERLTGTAKQDLSIYSRKRIQDMFAKGHLFAWHLFLESRPLWMASEISFVESLGKPSEYSASAQDAFDLADLATEARNSLQMHDCNIIYDLGILYVCLRNIALIASTSLCNTPVFGPLSPLLIEVPELTFPFTENEYKVLIAARHASTRGTAPIQIDQTAALQMALLADDWVRSVATWISGVRK